MLYHYRGDNYKLVNENGLIKLYHKAVNKWSSGWTYIGIYKNTGPSRVIGALLDRDRGITCNQIIVVFQR